MPQQLRSATDNKLSTKAQTLIPGVDHSNQKRLITLGEGALYHAEANRFVYIDIEAPSVNFYNVQTQHHESYNIQQLMSKQKDQSNSNDDVVPKIGTVVATEDPDIYLLAIQNEDAGIAMFNYKTHTVTPFAKHPEWQQQNNRLNDGKCSPDGRLFVGTMLLDTIQPRTPEGSLYVVENVTGGQSDAPAAFTRVFDNVTISNGIVWSNDGKTMYYIDTPNQRVDAFSYDVSAGRVEVESRKTVIKTTFEQDGYPDGCCIDSEGMLWVCHWMGSNVSRYNPATGELLHRISIPASCVTSCAFGGESLQDLFVTTANNKVDISKETEAGSVFVIRNVGVTGVKSPVFKLTAKL